MKKKTIKIRKSQLVEGAFHLNGAPLSLKDYKHMRPMYDMGRKKLVMQFGRQTTKSSTMANLMLANSMVHPGFHSMYVSPTVDQTKVFSNDRLGPLIMNSPYVKNNYLSNKLEQNVFRKKLRNESTMYLRYALLSADRLRGYCLTNCDYYTYRGWVPATDLKKDDLVLTKNEKTGEFEFQKPTEIIEQDYDGQLDIYTAKGFRCEVTPEHRMHLSFDVRADHAYGDKTLPLEWQTDYKSKDLYNRNFKLGLGDINQCYYKGKSPEFFELPELRTNIRATGNAYVDGGIRTYKPIKLPIKPFMRWMGWWLSEGWTVLNNPTIGIAQSKEHNPKYWKEIDELFNELFPKRAKYNTGIETWVLNSEYRTLYEWLKPLGKSGDKYIPRELLEYTEYLPDLLDALYKGDGDNCRTYKKSDRYKDYLRLNTKSKELANTVQEAWLRIGKLASIRHRDRKYGRIYTVELKSKNYFNFYLNRASCSGQVTHEHYKGKIYCVTVPNHNFVARHSKEKMPFVTGNSNDMILYDEAQDLLQDIVPVANQSMSHSMFKWLMFAGTPKRTIGTLSFYWNLSSKNEWMPKCPACNKYNYLDEKNIGKEGLICRFCGHMLDPNNGLWVSTGPKNAEYEGFRVSQLQFFNAPWVDWKNDIIIPHEQYGITKFYNEVLGIAHDEGVVPITEAEIRACCTGGPMTDKPTRVDQGHKHVIGLDYGPVNSNKSYTLLSVLCKKPGPAKVIQVKYLKKYEGKEADFSFIHDDVPVKFNRWNAYVIGSDYGLGEASNSELRAKLGEDKVIAYQHTGTQKDRVRWNKQMRAYTLSRNTTLGQLFARIKKRKIIFPRWEDFEPFARDILAIMIDYDEEKGTMSYINSEPDDAMHSILYGGMALELLEGMTDEY